MKEKMKQIITLVLLICMMATLTVGAAADYTCNAVKGQAVGKTEIFSAATEIDSYTLSSDSRLPSGMQISKEGTKLYISGTPNESGTMTCRLTVISNTNSTVESTVVTFAVAEPATPAPTATPTPTATAKPSASPTASPKPTGAPKITKQPTGETVEVGGRAVFIAKADNAKTLIWRIVSADTTNTYTAEEAPNYFKGLTVSGLGTEKLILDKIPSSLNGWSVECKFVGDGGTSFSNGARISVTTATKPTATATPKPATTSTPAPTATPAASSNPSGGTAAAPTIDTQPKATNAIVGEKVTLSASAHGSDGGTIAYQWYSAPIDNLAAIEPVSGATAGSYIPPQTVGTRFYCVGVTDSVNGTKSDVSYSQLVAVNYIDPTATPTPAPTDSANSKPASDGIMSSVIFFVALGALTLVALVVVIIIIRRNGKTR